MSDCVRCGHDSKHHTLLTGVVGQRAPACTKCHRCLSMVWPGHITEAEYQLALRETEPQKQTNGATDRENEGR